MNIIETGYFCHKRFSDEQIAKNKQAFETIEHKDQTAFMHHRCLMQSLGTRSKKRWIFPVLDEELGTPEFSSTDPCIKIYSVAPSKQPLRIRGFRRTRLTASRSSWRRCVRLKQPTLRSSTPLSCAHRPSPGFSSGA